MLAKGSKSGGRNQLDESAHEALHTIKAEAVTSRLWHQRLGHPNSNFLNVLGRNNVINVSQWTSKSPLYNNCQLGKQCKLIFDNSNSIGKFILDKIH